MNYGLYLSASGLMTNLYRQDVSANNLANVNTVGFKRDLAAIQQRDAEAVEEGLGSEVRHELLDLLGGGALAGLQRISFTPGPFQETGNPLDAALESPEAFFAVLGRDPGSGQERVRLTRDGRFARDGEGYLVTIAGGQRVLDPNDQPIQIPSGGVVTISQSGQLLRDGEPVGQIQVTGVGDREQLVKQGQNLYGFAGEADGRTAASLATVRSGFVEASGVDPIQELMQMIEATKAATANGNLIRYHDLLMDRAVNVLGRVA